MRGREFIMKDAYSFHVDEAALEREYRACTPRTRASSSAAGWRFRAGRGRYGGDRRLDVARVHGARRERARTRCVALRRVRLRRERRAGAGAHAVDAARGAGGDEARPLEKVATPGAAHGRARSAAFLNDPPDRLVKTLLYLGATARAVGGARARRSRASTSQARRRALGGERARDGRRRRPSSA